MSNSWAICPKFANGTEIKSHLLAQNNIFKSKFIKSFINTLLTVFYRFTESCEKNSTAYNLSTNGAVLGTKKLEPAIFQTDELFLFFAPLRGVSDPPFSSSASVVRWTTSPPPYQWPRKDPLLPLPQRYQDLAQPNGLSPDTAFSAGHCDHAKGPHALL
jgi:hypothetical protein